jgi:hypothetical protein
LLKNSRPTMAAGVVVFFAIHSGLSKPASHMAQNSDPSGSYAIGRGTICRGQPQLRNLGLYWNESRLTWAGRRQAARATPERPPDMGGTPMPHRTTVNSGM